jgi:hypothetical protein
MSRADKRVSKPRNNSLGRLTPLSFSSLCLAQRLPLRERYQTLREGIVKLQFLSVKKRNRRYSSNKAPFDFGYYRPKMCEAFIGFVKDSATNEETLALHSLLMGENLDRRPAFGGLTRSETTSEIRLMFERLLERAKFFFGMLDVAERHFSVKTRESDTLKRNTRNRRN